jgi:HK97 family phage prohead protease
MPENLKKLTDQIKTDLSAKVASSEFASYFEKVKAAADKDSGTFEVIASTADRDRQGDVVRQEGWDLTFYRMNPVVLWAHDYSQLPIGVCTSIEVVNGRLLAKGKFAPEDCNPFAQQVRRLYDAGMVKTTSVGFIPREFAQDSREEITKAELLEFSFVPVPANPYALTMRQAKELNLDFSILSTKGLTFAVKEETPAPTPAPAPAPAPDPVPVPAPAPEPTPTPAPEPTPAPTETPTPTPTDAEKIAAACEAITKAAEVIDQAGATLRGLLSSSNGAALPVVPKDQPANTDEANEFIFTRKMTKEVVNTLTSALEKFNERISAKGKNYKK